MAGSISLTNVAMIVLVVKIAYMETLQLPEVAAFFFTLLNYSHKRSLNAKAWRQVNEQTLEREVVAINAQREERQVDSVILNLSEQKKEIEALKAQIEGQSALKTQLEELNAAIKEVKDTADAAKGKASVAALALGIKQQTIG